MPQDPGPMSSLGVTGCSHKESLWLTLSDHYTTHIFSCSTLQGHSPFIVVLMMVAVRQEITTPGFRDNRAVELFMGKVKLWLNTGQASILSHGAISLGLGFVPLT